MEGVTEVTWVDDCSVAVRLSQSAFRGENGLFSPATREFLLTLCDVGGVVVLNSNQRALF